MGRLNVILLGLVIYCAVMVVDQQHAARSLFVAIGHEQQAEYQIEVAFNRLQLQQVALAKGERVDEVARTRLSMSLPDAKSVVFMPVQQGLQRE